MYVKPSYYVKLMKNVQSEEYEKKIYKKNEEETYNDMLKSVYIMLKATEPSKEADIVETRLGINSNSVAINLDDIQTYNLPSASEEVKTTEQAPNNTYVVDLLRILSK